MDLIFVLYFSPACIVRSSYFGFVMRLRTLFKSVMQKLISRTQRSTKVLPTSMTTKMTFQWMISVALQMRLPHRASPVVASSMRTATKRTRCGMAHAKEVDPKVLVLGGLRRSATRKCTTRKCSGSSTRPRRRRGNVQTSAAQAIPASGAVRRASTADLEYQPRPPAGAPTCHLVLAHLVCSVSRQASKSHSVHRTPHVQEGGPQRLQTCSRSLCDMPAKPGQRYRLPGGSMLELLDQN